MGVVAEARSGGCRCWGGRDSRTTSTLSRRGEGGATVDGESGGEQWEEVRRVDGEEGAAGTASAPTCWPFSPCAVIEPAGESPLGGTEVRSAVKGVT